MKKNAVLLTLLLLLGGLGVLPAFQLTPMSAVIDPTDGIAGTTFTIVNTGGELIAVQLRTTTRSILPDGTEINSDASGALQVFPSQLILRPGLTQTVRVRWTGEIPTREIPFRLVAEQLPVNLNREDQDSTGVQFMLRYRATIYVRPPGVEARLTIGALRSDLANQTITFEVENSGTRHQAFADGVMILQEGQPGEGGREARLEINDIEPLVIVNVLPGESRRIVLPTTLLPFFPGQISFQFDRP